jgi:thiosulfate reductase cytochrome b subunit
MQKPGHDKVMRTAIRWLHLVLAIPIIGYIYSPFDVIPTYAFPTRFIFFPTMVLSGLWMWKGHWVRRLFAGKSS